MLINHTERVVDRVIKEARTISKIAKIFDVGDVVVLTSQVQGLNKGNLYKVTKNSNPGMISIAEYYPEKVGVEKGRDDTADKVGEVGNEIGEYRTDHFVRYNQEG